MLASFPASMLNQNSPDLGIPNRFRLDPSRSRPSVGCGRDKDQPFAHALAFLLRANRDTVVPRQRNDQLSKDAQLGLDINPTAMLLDNDVMRH